MGVKIIKYVCHYDKNYGMDIDLYDSEVEVCCWGLINMSEQYLSHTLSRDEAIALAKNILANYEEKTDG